MNLYHLKIFTYVAKCKSVTIAAKELEISQPAVSHQLHDFQHKIGLQLIDMIDKKIYLTDVGEAFFKEGKKLIELENNVEEIKKDFLTRKSGSIRIVSSPSFSAYYLPEVISRFKKKYSEIFIEVVSRDSFSIIKDTANLYYDLGFITQRIEHEKIITRTILNEDMVAIVSPDHELSKKDFISPEDLKGFELIMHEKTSGSRKTSDAYFKKYGIELNITGIYDNSETIKNLVKRYSCVSMMSITDVIEDAKNGSLVAIPFNPSMIREYCMVFHKRKYLNKPLEEFISIAEEWCSLYASIMSEKLKNGKIENYTGLNII